jgi:hypothetical protein
MIKKLDDFTSMGFTSIHYTIADTDVTKLLDITELEAHQKITKTKSSSNFIVLFLIAFTMRIIR